MTFFNAGFSKVKTKQPSYRKEIPLGAFPLGTSLICIQEQAVFRNSYFSSYPGIHPRCGKLILLTCSAPKVIFQVMIDCKLSGKLDNSSDRLEILWGHNMKSQKEAACMNDNIQRRENSGIRVIFFYICISFVLVFKFPREKNPTKNETKQPQARESVLQPSSSLAIFFSYIFFSSNKQHPMG